MPLTQGELNIFLQKVAEFVKLAIDELDTRHERILEMSKTAQLQSRKQEGYHTSLQKAAAALYDADFLTDEVERKRFLKRASEDPSYLSSVIVKVCNAADVTLIGSPARVAVRQKQGEEFDPVKARAFGYDYSGHASSALDDI